jgi:hypothetical protein
LQVGLAGASHAGLVLPVKGSPCTLYPAPDFEATDILAMAEQLVAAYSE